MAAAREGSEGYLLMNAFEHTGFWWDPREPETRWPGTLKFDPVAGATLSRTVSFHPSQIFGERREFKILHGDTTSGLPITCYIASRQAAPAYSPSQ